MYASTINNAIFWLFWSGLYKSQENLDNILTHIPLYVMMILLILEKQA
jgi:hypothetical protein